MEGAVTDRKSLLAIRDEVSNITGGHIDYLINNAAFVPQSTEDKAIDEYEDSADQLEADLIDAFRVNVLGVINTNNVFLPLVKKSSIKKVILISSGMADPALVNNGVPDSAPYTISKAAANMAICKYNAKYKDQGVLFFSISPGIVATRPGMADLKIVKDLKVAFPDWKGPLTPVESVEMMLKVFDDFSLENGNGGSFVSHYGTQQWL